MDNIIDNVMDNIMNNVMDEMNKARGQVMDKVMDGVMDNTKTRYVANEQVVITDLGDELVVMEPASGKMFSLNSSGRILWQRLPATAEELTDALCEAFEVSREDAQTDSQAWLAALVQIGLVQAEPHNLN